MELAEETPVRAGYLGPNRILEFAYATDRCECFFLEPTSGGGGKRWLGKFLKRGHAGDKTLEARLRAEFELLQKVAFPGIPKVKAFHANRGNEGFVLEHIDAWSLADLVDRGKPFPRIAAVALLLLLLAKVHRRRVVHGGPTPRNVWIARGKGGIHLTDFFFGRNETPLRKISGMIFRNKIPRKDCATPWCLAPEVVAEGVSSMRADVYSFGACAHYLLTNEPPFNRVEDDFADLVDVPASGGDVELAIEHLPYEVNETLSRCLRLDPEARPSSAQAVLQKLGSWAEEAVKIKRDPLSQELTTRAHRKARAEAERTARMARAAQEAAKHRDYWLD